MGSQIRNHAIDLANIAVALRKESAAAAAGAASLLDVAEQVLLWDYAHPGQLSSARPEFASNTPTEAIADKIEVTQAGFTALLTMLEGILPPSHERALVVTKLQEACMWAVRAAQSTKGGL